VSLLLANQLLVTISEDSFAMIHRARGFTGRILDQKHEDFSQENGGTLNQSFLWQKTLSHLDTLFASMKISPKTQLKVILASDFVRYLSLPAQQVQMSQEEKLAYAVAAYQDVYGSCVDTWDIKLNDSAPRQPTIAVAVDKALLEALNQLAIKYQLKLVSTQPYLMCAFNALTGQVNHVSGYLAIVELKRLLLVSLQTGKFISMRTFLLGAQWQGELKSLLERELVMAGNSNPALYIYAPSHKGVVVDAIKNCELKRIGTRNSSLNNQHMAMLEAAL
jgi:hypothetical protein